MKNPRELSGSAEFASIGKIATVMKHVPDMRICDCSTARKQNRKKRIHADDFVFMMRRETRRDGEAEATHCGPTQPSVNQARPRNPRGFGNIRKTTSAG